MKNIKNILVIALLAASAAFGQIALTQTTLSAAISINQNSFTVASTTNIVGCSNTQPCPIYIMDPGNYRGELVQVTNVPASGQLVTQRGGLFRSAHVSGALVVIGNMSNPAQSFPLYDPYGSCTAAPTQATSAAGIQAVLFTPWINAVNGNQWLCSSVTGTWVPGWGNPWLASSLAPTAAQAGVAGLMTPTGPLWHETTNTDAVTGWTLPVGFNGGYFCVIPDQTFTWTTATNIALAGTAVVSKTLCFTWDWNAVKWYPSYIA